ncbi:hypothetical protein D3C72_1959800 [compost metagenome]
MVSVWAYTTVPPGATWPLLFGVSEAPSCRAVEVTVTASVLTSEAMPPVEATAVDCTLK